MIVSRNGANYQLVSPQGTKLGPWLFLLMIDDIDVTDLDLWKYVDDTTMAEYVPKNHTSNIQDAVSVLATQSYANKFQLNESKCKEFRISFAKCEPVFAPIIVNGNPIERVSCIKLLGLNISSDLKWNNHISEIIKKTSARLYCLRQLKRANIATKELITFYKSCIRPIIEYACPIFHNALPQYLSDDLERLQKRALRIILPSAKYTDALEACNLESLYGRREVLTTSLLREICNDSNHKLHHLLPEVNKCHSNLRRNAHSMFLFVKKTG